MIHLCQLWLRCNYTEVVGSIPDPRGLQVQDFDHFLSLVFRAQHCERGGGNCEKGRSHPSHGGGDRGRGSRRTDVGGAGPPGSEQDLREGVPPRSALRAQQSATHSHGL